MIDMGGQTYHHVRIARRTADWQMLATPLLERVFGLQIR